ncbi:ribokinase [Streptomyces scabiei]|nr:sugar kinase [Streptomyces scabiei]MBP5860018.1 ribokinase [Streptomyces sp. LBUM 1484]MBP5871264.1 ribokinase [Streptomyces sp. LBUM 1485]MBP5879692.1 ribokinase [Streptomyces sp. LBUM 1477]MBP5887519.1 ribokinase [Streptomyces sp. LBUM 1487]MBP5903518.1 ribokinase [Streptomyces sp. LBUM 1488]MBP5912798.1 ribokinase [Streptomyces sp. LBUM 1486]QTU51382.1 ribokinase [Streptomyces sp. LBUM 1482]QTU59500.1 ribokinase [Streptomyces sp. LBUM 1480]QTU67570.1 ribokinase [Streptomyces sp. LBUM
MPGVSPQVVVIGSVNIDHVVVADAFPSPGETVLGRTAYVTLGGKGANQAAAAASGGVRTAMIARVGEDAEADRARARLVAGGVDVDAVTAVSGAETGTAWITTAAGDNTIVVVAGANHQWPSEGDPTEGLGARASVVLAQLEIPLDVVRRAADACRGRFLLNAAPAAELPDDLIARCDVLIVNEHEQAVVSGRSATDAAEEVEGAPETAALRRAHDALRARGAKAVVTTLGEAGAVVTDADGVSTALRAVPATVVDTTGAGDAFAGVLAARLAAGDSLLDAARLGIAAGSMAVRVSGAPQQYADLATLRALAATTPPIEKD